jgi:hypothetical protein
MNLDQVTYGNPTIEQKKYLEEISIVDDLFPKLKENNFPLTSSELVKDELNEIVDYLNDISSEGNESYLARYKSYDRSLLQNIVTTFQEKEIDVEELCKNIIDDVQPLIAKLKYHFQRPRPSQVAQYYKLKLFPYSSFSSNTPSYPSGHTLQAYVILNVIGDKYPNEYQFCKEMINDIAYSRIYLGLHFATDNDFAKFVGQEILKNPNFTKKYEI